MMTLGGHLPDRTIEAKALFHAFAAAAREECGSFSLRLRPLQVGLAARRTFAAVSLRRGCIDVGFILPYRAFSSRIRRLKTFGLFRHGHSVRIRSAVEIDDEVREWLRDAYRLSQHEWRPDSGRGIGGTAKRRPSDGGSDGLVPRGRPRRSPAPTTDGPGLLP